MIILLRGHIRNAFDTKDLYKLIKNIKKFHTSFEIYIHTWNIFSSNISWRKINIDSRKVKEHKILNYFADLKQYIKKIIIDDDTKIEVIGNKDGLVCSSKCPIIGWKYMWYGIYSGIKSIKEENTTDEYVVNMRFDILTNSFSKPYDDIINFIRFNRDIKEFKKNIFINNTLENIGQIRGIDNFYIGSINTMYLLIEHFYSNLDAIIPNYPNNRCQESLVFLENEIIFEKSSIRNELVV